MRKLALLIAAAGLLVAALPASAQQTAKVLATCGSASGYTAGGTNYITVDTTGAQCGTSTGSGGGVTTSPVAVSTTARNGTITTGGTAQNAMANNTSRKVWCVTNSATATEYMFVRANGVATVSDTPVAPGQQVCNQPGTIDQGVISVIAATTGHAFSGYEAQ